MRKHSDDGNVWLNRHDLDCEEHRDVQRALLGDGMLFDRLSIDKSNINAVEQYEWTIAGDEYEKCKELAASEYVKSPQNEYHIASDCIIYFHFNFYGRMTFEDKEYCGVFVEIDEMPDYIKGIDIEVDIKCNEKKAYRQLLRDQKLTQKKRICGFRIFRTSVLDNNSCFEWTFGVKIFNMKTMETDHEETDNEFTEIELDSLFSTLADLY